MRKIRKIDQKGKNIRNSLTKVTVSYRRVYLMD